MQSRNSADSPQVLQNLVFDMLKKTEGSGHTAYQLSHAKVAESGYTFGVCQHDCKTNPDAFKFISILLTKHQISNSIILKIKDNVKLFPQELEAVNRVLHQSQEKIDALDNQRVIDSVKHISTVIDSLPQDIKGRFKNYIHAKLQLLDFHNQFNLEKDGRMKQFLCNKEVKLHGGTINLKIDYTKNIFNEIRRFIQHTKYGMEHQKCCKTRFANLDGFLNDLSGSVYLIPKSEPLLQPLVWPEII